MVEQPISLRIEKILDEAKGVRTFMFRYHLESAPGQFIMAWLPRQDQKPFGISYQDSETFGITVQNVGQFTEKIFDLREGDFLGIQGPYGRPFDTRGNVIALVGGGFGSAPLAYLFEILQGMGKKVFFFIGARTGDCLVFRERFKGEIVYCTDDGTCGRKGLVTEALKEYITNERIDMVYTCGPEKMMQEVIRICDEHAIDCQISMERYMKCGFGICGQCCVDPRGIRLCQEGPVLDKSQVKEISEFGSYRRDGSGKRKEI